MASKVNLKKYLKIGDRWQFVPVYKRDNGEFQAAYVVIDNEQVESRTGTFYLEWRSEGKRIQKPCGSIPKDALKALKGQRELLDGAEKAAIQLDPEELALPAEKISIKSACAKFLNNVKSTKAPATYEAYSKDIRWFLAHINLHNIAQVTRDDIIRLFGVGRDEKQAQATINRSVGTGLQAIRDSGALVQLKKGDWPKIPETKVGIYEPHEIKKFLKACATVEWLIFQVFLQYRISRPRG
jgi:hypothetical protein